MATSINCLTPLLEPFGTSDILNTPLYLNKGETMFLQPSVTIPLNGDEEYVYDLDADNISKDLASVVTNNEPYPVAFPNSGTRKVSLSVYEKVFVIDVELTNVSIKSDTHINNVTLIKNTIFNTYFVSNNKLYMYDNNNNFVVERVFNGIAKDLDISTSNVILLTTTNIYSFDLDLNTSINQPISNCDNISVIQDIVAMTSITSDYVYLYDISTNNVTSFLTGQGNSLISHDTDKFYTVNKNTNKLDIIDISTLNHTFINLSRPAPLSVSYHNNALYIRYFSYIDSFNMNMTFRYTLNVLPMYIDTILFNTFNDEAIIFVNSNNKCVIKKFDINTGLISDVTLTLDNIVSPVLNTNNNSITFFYNNNVNNTKNICNINASNLDINYNYSTNTNITAIIEISNVVKGYGVSEYYVLDTVSNITNKSIRGKMITSATKTFQVYDFPTEILCNDVATYQEVLDISVDDPLTAETYTWYVNGTLYGSGKSIIYTYGADIKTNIECVIKSGYITKTLTKVIALSKSNEANNYTYEKDVTENLLFFNKDGDRFNAYLEDGVWKSEMYFDTNSNDTYKSISVNVMEHVSPITLETDNNLLIKNQIFNEFGMIFNRGGKTVDISNFMPVDKKSYTKKIYTNTSNIKKGYEIEIHDLYTGVVDANNILTSYSLSEMNGRFTVLEVQKDYILIYSETNNSVFDEKYISGSYRNMNNTVLNITPGYIRILNSIILKSVENYNTDWNEPFYNNGMFLNKPLSIINSRMNENVVYYETSYTKNYKRYVCDIPDLGTDISFKFHNKKIELGTSLITIYPKTNYNSDNIFIYDKTLNTDYTPALLKKGTNFAFYEMSEVFTVKSKDISSNLLKPITNTKDGYKIQLSENFIFDLTVDKTNYTIKYADFPETSIYDLIKNVSNYINGLVGITSFYDNDTVYIYPLSTKINISNNTNIKIIDGCLSNKPSKILIESNFIDISNQYGYTHFDNMNNTYYLYYNNDWVAIPGDKLILFVDSTSSMSEISQDFTTYLTDNLFVLQYDISYGNITNFINKNFNVINSFDLTPSIVDDKLVFEQTLLSYSNETYTEPLLSYTTEYTYADVIILSDDSVLKDENNHDISVLPKRKIIFNDLSDNLSININGINYKTDTILTTTPELNTEYTLLNWGLTKYIDETNILENDTYFYENLESQGILVWLSKTDSSNFNTLNIEGRYPNIKLNVSDNQTSIYKHSEISFTKIVNKLSLTINNKIFTVDYNSSINQTLMDFVKKYYSVLAPNILLSSINDKLYINTSKDEDISYTVFAGINDNPYTIVYYRVENMGCVISSNEVRNLVDDLEQYNFSTGMVVNIENSMFYNNNQEYNIIYVDNASLVLSYQGPFWKSSDKLGYIKTRHNFDWKSYGYVINTEDDISTGIFTDTNTAITPNFTNPSKTVYDSANNKLLVMHNNNSQQDKVTVIDLITNTISSSVTVGSYPVYGRFNAETQSVFIVNQNSIKLSEIKNGVLHNEILIGYQANYIVFDYDKNKAYLTLPYDNSVMTVDLVTNSIQNIIFLNINATPFKMVIDDKNRTVYVLSENDMVYSIDMDREELSGSYNTGNHPIDISFTGEDIYVINQNSNDVTLINNFLTYSIPLDSSPISMVYSKNYKKLFVLTNLNKICVIDVSNNVISTISTSNVTKLLLVPFSDKIFLYNSINSILGYFNLSDTDYNITNINYDISNLESTLNLSYTDKAVVALSDKVHIIEEAPLVQQIQNYPNDILSSLKIKLSTRDFIRYPRERYVDDSFERIVFEASLAKKSDIFLYDISDKLTPIYNISKTLPFLDDKVLSVLPTPMQFFLGFKGVYDIVSNDVLTITRNKKIKSSIIKSAFEFTKYDNSITIKKFNFIETGYNINDTIEISGSDKNFIFKNAGLICVIKEIYIDKIVVSPINKDIVDENNIIDMTVEVLPQIVAEIQLSGETVTEDERYKVLTSNYGCDINRDDIYIFSDYDISDKGIDWVYMNNKRKEMLLNKNQIYNYIGSYKAVINSINYFGYNDLSFFEYYYNKDDKSYKKLEIPKFADNNTVSVNTDYVKQILPNDKYKKTNLFNLTYNITDNEGNYVLAYSLDEIIVKLLGLKKWLQNNVVPIGMNIKDITGVSTTSFSHQISASNKISHKYVINDSMTPMDFDVKAILQPLRNNSKTYNVRINFISDISDYFTIKIKTADIDKKYIQNFSYYKTDKSSINIVCDMNIDPYIMIETVSDNGYGATYSVQKTYSLLIGGWI